MYLVAAAAADAGRVSDLLVGIMANGGGSHDVNVMAKTQICWLSCLSAIYGLWLSRFLVL